MAVGFHAEFESLDKENRASKFQYVLKVYFASTYINANEDS